MSNYSGAMVRISDVVYGRGTMGGDPRFVVVLGLVPRTMWAGPRPLPSPPGAATGVIFGEVAGATKFHLGTEGV